MRCSSKLMVPGCADSGLPLHSHVVLMSNIQQGNEQLLRCHSCCGCCSLCLSSSKTPANSWFKQVVPLHKPVAAEACPLCQHVSAATDAVGLIFLMHSGFENHAIQHWRSCCCQSAFAAVAVAGRHYVHVFQTCFLRAPTACIERQQQQLPVLLTHSPISLMDCYSIQVVAPMKTHCECLKPGMEPSSNAI